MTLTEEIRRLTEHLREAHDARPKEIAGLRAEAVHLRAEAVQRLADFHTTHQTMAAEQRERLVAFVDDLRRSVGGQLQDFGTTRRDMATGQQEHLSSYTATLRETTAAFRRDFRAVHQAMASEQRRRGSNDRAHLASAVAEMRGRMQADLRETQADLREARKVWEDFSASMRQREAGVRAAPPVYPPPSARPAEKPPVAVAPPEDVMALQVLAYLAEHPEGARLEEIRDLIGVPRRQVVRLFEELTAAGKARRDEESGRYFSI